MRSSAVYRPYFLSGTQCRAATLAILESALVTGYQISESNVCFSVLTLDEHSNIHESENRWNFCFCMTQNGINKTVQLSIKMFGSKKGNLRTK